MEQKGPQKKEVCALLEQEGIMESNSPQNQNMQKEREILLKELMEEIEILDAALQCTPSRPRHAF